MAVVAAPQRFEVWLVNLDSTQGSKTNKARLCVVISPDELNRYLRTVTVAALTSAQRAYPSRVECEFQGRTGQAALDHIRSVDKTRLVKKLGELADAEARAVCDQLVELFSY